MENLTGYSTGCFPIPSRVIFSVIPYFSVVVNQGPHDPEPGALIHWHGQPRIGADGRPDFPTRSADGILAGEQFVFRRPLSRSLHFKIGKFFFSGSQRAHSESRQAGNLHVRGDLEQREVTGAKFGEVQVCHSIGHGRLA
jgi:hypothetical protein